MRVEVLLLVVAVDVGDSGFFLGPSGQKVLIKFSRVIEASMVSQCSPYRASAPKVILHTFAWPTCVRHASLIVPHSFPEIFDTKSQWPCYFCRWPTIVSSFV